MSEQLNQAQLTAPETIYLQHNDSGYMDEPFPTDHSGTSWCDEEVFNCDVRYVRADIAEGKQAELLARIAELEKDVEWWQSCTKDCGDVINDGIESRQQLRSKVAELERQAAIGRRAVEVVDQALPVWDGDGIDPERHHCELTLLNERHRARAEIFSRLRDAEQAAPAPVTVAVDAGALEALRSAMSKLRAPMSRAEYAVARAGIIEAAYSLLAGGGE